MGERLIFHVDVNSAFLSWEAAKRVAMGLPDPRLIPSAIGGDKDKRTGIITAKSIPAKKYGIITGEPVSSALRKCPKLQIYPPDFKLYEKNSKAFMAVCAKYAPVLQKFSVDECFLDMTGTSLIYPDPIALAYKIKDEIRDTLGFTVNVGIGSNKLLAKMASDFEKPDKVHTLFSDEIRTKMWPLPVGDLLFVGKASVEKLNMAGIRTIGELAEADLIFVRSLIGEKGGKQAHDYANGIDESPVTDEHEPPKGYNVSTTLEKDVTDFIEADRIIRELAESVTARMRRDGAKAYCVGVDIRYSRIADRNANTPSSRFTNKSHQKRLQEPTDITEEVHEVCMELLHELWKKEPLRLMGIALSDLTFEQYEQISLFRDEKKEKSKKLDAMMDSITDKYGKGKVYRAGGGMYSRIGRKYEARSEIEREEKNIDE